MSDKAKAIAYINKKSKLESSECNNIAREIWDKVFKNGPSKTCGNLP